MEGLLRPSLERAFMVLSPGQKAEAVARSTVKPGS
jgi:simple sugar transport system permease protein